MYAVCCVLSTRSLTAHTHTHTHTQADWAGPVWLGPVGPHPEHATMAAGFLVQNERKTRASPSDSKSAFTSISGAKNGEAFARVCLCLV
jgi:hypothetical protein